MQVYSEIEKEGFSS